MDAGRPQFNIWITLNSCIHTQSSSISDNNNELGTFDITISTSLKFILSRGLCHCWESTICTIHGILHARGTWLEYSSREKVRNLCQVGQLRYLPSNQGGIEGNVLTAGKFGGTTRDSWKYIVKGEKPTGRIANGFKQCFRNGYLLITLSYL